MNLETVFTIADIIDARDGHAKGHSARVAGYCKVMAEALGWNQGEIQNLYCVALLHDIGKIGVSDSVLKKQGKLTELEQEMVREHTTIGDRLVKDIAMTEHMREGIRSHHEHWDGSGYPDGLKGSQIPVYARIIGIMNRYDLLSSGTQLTDTEIAAAMEKGRGTEFAPEYLDLFLELLAQGKLKPDGNHGEDRDRTEGARLFERVSEVYYQDAVAQRDYLTGLWNRETAEKMIRISLQKQDGFLTVIDLDNLKLVNDLHGHMAGDLALQTVAQTLEEAAPQYISARVGGDEFFLFAPESDYETFKTVLDHIFASFQNKILQEETLAATSLSAGICHVARDGSLKEANEKADKALYHVKQNGKQGYFYYTDKTGISENDSKVDMRNLMSSLRRQGQYQGAFSIAYREFARVYELIVNIAERYDYSIQLLLITVSHRDGDSFTLERQERIMFNLEKAVNQTLRSVDVGTRFSSVQMLVILTDAGRDNVQTVVDRIFRKFQQINSDEEVVLSYDSAEYEKGTGRK